MKKIYYIHYNSINIIFLVIKKNFTLIIDFFKIKKNILLNFTNLIFVVMKKYFFSFKQKDKKIFLNNKLSYLDKKTFYKEYGKNIYVTKRCRQQGTDL